MVPVEKAACNMEKTLTCAADTCSCLWLTGRSARAGDASEQVKKQVKALILSSASELPLEDQAILLAIAGHESGFNPSSRNPRSSACGIFQVIDSTWRALGFETSGRQDVMSQVQAGLALYRENMKVLERQYGQLHGEQRLIEMYRLHHDGPGVIDLGGRAIARRSVLPLFLQFSRILQACEAQS